MQMRGRNDHPGTCTSKTDSKIRERAGGILGKRCFPLGTLGLLHLLHLGHEPLVDELLKDFIQPVHHPHWHPNGILLDGQHLLPLGICPILASEFA